VAKAKKQNRGAPKISMDIPGKIVSLLREVGLISLLAVVGYLLICLLTNSPADPGPTHTGSGGEVQNMGGNVGAWFSDFLFTIFGKMAYLFLILMIVTVWRIYKERGSEGGSSNWDYVLPVVGFLTAMTGACGLEQIYFPVVNPESIYPSGGILGQYIGSGFTSGFGVVGASLILIGLLITGITLVGHVSWFDLMDKIGFQAFAVFGWLKLKIEDLSDRKKGAKVRKERQVSVKEFRTVLSSRKSSPRLKVIENNRNGRLVCFQLPRMDRCCLSCPCWIRRKTSLLDIPEKHLNRCPSC